MRTINHVHTAARVALQQATKERLIAYNPAKDANPPRYSTSEREYRVLSEEEVATFFEAAKGGCFEAFFVVAVLAGPPSSGRSRGRTWGSSFRIPPAA